MAQPRPFFCRSKNDAADGPWARLYRRRAYALWYALLARTFTRFGYLRVRFSFRVTWEYLSDRDEWFARRRNVQTVSGRLDGQHVQPVATRRTRHSGTAFSTPPHPTATPPDRPSPSTLRALDPVVASRRVASARTRTRTDRGQYVTYKV